MTNGRQAEIEFVFDGSGTYDVYLDHLCWNSADGFPGVQLTELETKAVAEKVKHYCDRRGLSFRAHW